jgi:hypothetical protein
MGEGQAWWLMPIILIIPEADIRRISVQSQSTKKFLKPHLNKSWVRWHTPVIPATLEG